MALLELDAGGRWTKTDEWLPAGRTFYLGHVLDSSHHQAIAGFVVAGDGAHRLEDHDGAGLPRSTFSTDCRLPAYPDRRRFVTLEETVLHRDASASGDPSASSDACRLKLGTTLEDWERDPKSGYATLGGPEVKRACGFSPGYAARLVYGELLLR